MKEIQRAIDLINALPIKHPQQLEEKAVVIQALQEYQKSGDYTYPTIKDYEEIVGFKVNEAFCIGWSMARTTNKQLQSLISAPTNQEAVL